MLPLPGYKEKGTLKKKLRDGRYIIFSMVWVGLVLGHPVAVIGQEMPYKKYTLKIPSSDVETALFSLARKTGKSLIFHSTGVPQKHTVKLDGDYTLFNALSTMLKGTNLSGDLTKSGLIVVSLKKSAAALSQEEMDMVNQTLKKILLAGTSAFMIGGMPMPSLALDDAENSEMEEFEEVVVTGTRIANGNFNTSSPVVVLEAAEFEKTGATSIRELLTLLPEIGSDGVLDSSPFRSGTGEFNLNGLSGGGTAALGADSVSLRSLGANATLILVNGRRIAPHSAVSGGPSSAQAVTNLDSIPIEAIERIEVLKGGASTIYGSDAMAGVINIILKKGREDMRTLTAMVKMATQWDNTQFRLAYTHGFSNIGGGDNSLSLSAEYIKQDSLLGSQRLPARETLNSKGGTLRRYDLSGNEVYRPYRDFNPLASACGRIDVDNKCLDDIGNIIELTPASDKVGISAIYDQSFQNGIDLFATATFSYRKEHTSLAPQEFSPNVIGRRDPHFPAGNPGEELFVELTDIGNKSRNVVNTSYSFVGGLKGDFSNSINWEVSGRLSKNTNEVTYKNYVLKDKFFTELLAGRYLVGQPGATPEDVVNKVRAPIFQRTGSSTSSGVDAHITGELFELPAGDISYAFGASYTRDTFKDRPDEIMSFESRNLLGGLGGAPYDASRSKAAVFGELLIPIVKNLDIELSARQDFDDVFGSHFSPKIGFRFDPIPGKIMFRGAYTEGFRAPSIVEFGRPIVINPNSFFALPTGPSAVSYSCSTQYFGFCFGIQETTRNNPDIKPETSTQYNFGIVLKPTDSLRISLDWYKINRENEIKFFSGIYSANTHPETIGKDSAGNVISIVSQFGNIGRTVNEGIDFTVRYSLDLGEYGTVSTNLSLVRNISDISEQLLGTGEFEEGQRIGFLRRPKWRGINSLSWAMDDWRTTLTYRYRSSYNAAINDIRLKETPCNSNPRNDKLRYNCVVPKHDTFNFNVTYTGFEDISFTLHIENIFDEIEFTDIRVIDAQNFRRIGREVSLRMNYKF